MAEKVRLQSRQAGACNLRFHSAWISQAVNYVMSAGHFKRAAAGMSFAVALTPIARLMVKRIRHSLAGRSASEGRVIERFEIPDVVHFEPKKFGDHRGYFSEVFRKDWFDENVGSFDFVQENQSLSGAVGTVRGLHFQTAPFAQGKLVRCLAGALVDVIVDIRHGSPTFGKWMAVELTAERGNQLWVPPGFAHGFCTLLPDTILCYKVTAYYSLQNDKGLAWNDPAIGIEWPDIADPDLMSAKDKVQPNLAELPAHFQYGAC